MRAATIVWTISLMMPASMAQSASITIESFCHADFPNGDSITTTHAIRANGETIGGCAIPIDAIFISDPPSAFASGHVGYSLQSGELFVFGTVVVSANQLFLDVPSLGDDRPRSTASITATLDLAVSSPGLPRPGQLLLSGGAFAGPSPGPAAASVECQVADFSDAGGGALPLFCIGSTPVILGEPFNVHFAAFGLAGADPILTAGQTRAVFDVAVQLQELNGTPVALQFAIPEPSTFFLVASALASLALRRTGKANRRTC